MHKNMMIEKLRRLAFSLRKDKFGEFGESLDQLGLRLEDGKRIRVPAKVKPAHRALPEHLRRICALANIPETKVSDPGKLMPWNYIEAER